MKEKRREKPKKNKGKMAKKKNKKSEKMALQWIFALAIKYVNSVNNNYIQT